MKKLKQFKELKKLLKSKQVKALKKNVKKAVKRAGKFWNQQKPVVIKQSRRMITFLQDRIRVAVRNLKVYLKK